MPTFSKFPRSIALLSLLLGTTASAQTAIPPSTPATATTIVPAAPPAPASDESVHFEARPGRGITFTT